MEYQTGIFFYGSVFMVRREDFSLILRRMARYFYSQAMHIAHIILQYDIVKEVGIPLLTLLLPVQKLPAYCRKQSTAL